MRIVPLRQTLIVQGRLEEHEALDSLLACLRRALGPRQRFQAGRCPAAVDADRFDTTVRSPAASKIEAALRDTTLIEFIETPLQDVIDYLKDMHKIAIQIETSALEDVGIGSDCPITMSLKGVSLRSALRLMLREYGLTYVIRDEVLLIVPDDVPFRTITRVYSVAELLGFGEMSDGLADALMLALARRDKPAVGLKECEAQKKQGPPKLRIVPYRQAIIVLANSEEHEILEGLLHDLSLGLQGKTSSPVCREEGASAGSTRSRQRAGKQAGNSGDNDPSRGDEQDPIAGPDTKPAKTERVDGDDPFGPGAPQTKDPFGGGVNDEDPFGGSESDADPSEGGADKKEDPFGKSSEDPFG
jgi:hypothetical protein